MPKEEEFGKRKEGSAIEAAAGPKNLKLVGPATVVDVVVDGVRTTALLDTGSMVTTINEGFCQQMLPGVSINPLSEMLVVTSSTGHQVPYTGTAEIQVDFHDLNGRFRKEFILALVVPETEWSFQVPLLLGTNVLHLGEDFENVLVATTGVETIPPGSIRQVRGILSKGVCRNALLLAEMLPTSSLPGDVRVVPALVEVEQTSHVVCGIQNFGKKSVHIPSNVTLCRLQQVREVMDPPPLPDDKRKPSGTISDNIVDEFNLTGVEENERKQLEELLKQWSHIFARSDYELGHTDRVKHKIELVNPKSDPIRQRHRRIPPSMYEEVQEHLKMMLDCGVIRPSSSAWRSPVVLVRKKDGSLRFCVDYRQLNGVTKRDAYDLPRVEETIDCLYGAKYLSCLDLKSGYWQVEVDEQDKPLTAFSVGPLGFYEFNAMPFGLSNSPATFQRLMEQCMGDLHLHKCLIYLDDIIVFSATLEEHLARLEAVFQRLFEAGLRLKPSKCQFLQKKVKYLGHIVSESGIEVDPGKVAAVQKMLPPKDVGEVQSFLGFVGFHRKFIQDFASIAQPLHELLRQPKKRKGKARQVAEFTWGDRQQVAFETLISKLCSAPVLGYADFSQSFLLHVDASQRGLGAVLMQIQDGKQRVIAYASRSLSRSEEHYPAHKLEFLALKWAVTEKFHDYLYGNHFDVMTDNNPLTYVMTSAKLDATGQRWVAALSSYDFSLSYLAGSKNLSADYLSRNVQDTEQKQSEDVVKALLQSCLTQHPWVQSLNVEESCVDSCGLLDGLVSMEKLDVANLQKQDEVIGTVISLLQRDEKLKATDFRRAKPELRKLLQQRRTLLVENDILFRLAKIGEREVKQLVVPSKLRRKVLKSLHDGMGHPGRDRTMDLVRCRFYWPGWAEEVRRKVSQCRNCVCRKAKEELAPLVPIVSTQPMQIVCIDYLSLEPSHGYGNVLVMTDHFSNFAQAIATRNQTAKTTARVLFEHFIVHYGVPEKIHSDQGANFLSKVIRELCKLMGIERSRTTPYHPMGNGSCERFNRTLLQMLGCLEADKKRAWKDHLSAITHAYNCTRSSATGFSPYELMFGRMPKLPIDIQFGLTSDEAEEESYSVYVDELRKSLKYSWDLAEKTRAVGACHSKKLYDRWSRGAVLKEGDRVLVKLVAFDGKHKLAYHWDPNPFVVVSQPDLGIPVYVVASESNRKKTRCLHRNLLLPVGKISQDWEEEEEGASSHVARAAEADSCEVSDSESEESLVEWSMPQDRRPLSETPEVLDPPLPSTPVPVLRRSTRVRRPVSRYPDPEFVFTAQLGPVPAPRVWNTRL